MIQRIRHYVHLFLAFFSDYISLLFRPLFYQFQYQHFRNEIKLHKKEKKLLILGNGPSLSMIGEYKDKFEEYDFFCVNLSINADLFFLIKPKNYIIVDNILWMHPENESFKNIYINAKRIDWDIEVFFPYNFPISVKRQFEENPCIKVHRYANNSWLPETPLAQRVKLWLYKKGLLSPNGSNVSIAAVYTALLSGYKNISLLGMEHSWMRDLKVNDKNEVVLVDRHFYEEVEHVWLDYDGNPIKLVDFLASQLTTFTGHMELRQFADYLGARIINRTPGSYIDAYERGKFEELLKS